MNFTAKQIARQRIQVLFQQASRTCRTNPKLAQRYIASARRIAMAARIRLPARYKRQICKNCDTLLVPGYSSCVRVKSRRETHVVITCLSCGYHNRFPIRVKKEKKELEQNNYQNETSR